ncbi:hypothetical protein C493_09463 [Natronolimnohabitans innermongolicus JCM 12255]|uniref:PGF-CTERM archaeal protein-sorting signal domain-containing protein n=1 Tax=Natronolimnohabitans innermongolicus JCM 12255 TaxID=1227499 RepID=L9X5U4_9EURY|nr:hypothetical protein C493_09463 [Natronolimnohabitans innermongolicus JCM 12255]
MAAQSPTEATAQEHELTADATVTVTEDGEIATFEIEQELPPEMADGMGMVGEFGEYDSLAEMTAEMTVEDDNGIDGYETAREDEREDAYVMTFVFDEIDASETEDMTVDATDDAVTLELIGFDEQFQTGAGERDDVPAMAAYSEYTVTAEMPGTITDSNADTADGTVATWDLADEPADELFVESGTDGTPTSDDTGGDDDADDGIPGFGPILAIAGLLGTTAALSRR